MTYIKRLEALVAEFFRVLDEAVVKTEDPETTAVFDLAAGMHVDLEMFAPTQGHAVKPRVLEGPLFLHCLATAGGRLTAPTPREGDEGEDALEAEVRAYAKEHKCSVGEAYVEIGRQRVRAERGAREQERQGSETPEARLERAKAYAAEHKCSLGAAYEAVGAKRAQAGYRARPQTS